MLTLVAVDARALGEPLIVVDIRQLDAPNDGRTDATAHFEQALQSIAAGGGIIDVAGGTYRVSNLTLPPHVTVRFHHGGRLLIDPNAQVQINGPLEAGPFHIFQGEGSVAVRPIAARVYPQWFGAVGDGLGNDGPALRQAIELASRTSGRLLVIPKGQYVFREHLGHVRCHIDSQGVLVREVDSGDTGWVRGLTFAPDHQERELDASCFQGVQAGDLRIPQQRNIPLADGSGSVDLKPGDVLRFHSSEWVVRRAVGIGHHYYDRNDMVQVVSHRGDVTPDFAFSYDIPDKPKPWRSDAAYDVADYVSHQGEIFKAIWPSGPGTDIANSHPEPAAPDPDHELTTIRIQRQNGSSQQVRLWVRVRTRVWYRPNDTPLTVNGLHIKARLVDSQPGRYEHFRSTILSVDRNHIVFNNLHIHVEQPELMVTGLLRTREAVHVTFNHAFVSGATSFPGYNILNGNVAHVHYNHCTSLNGRKGMDGRHGKHVIVNGGQFSNIEEHYGRNMKITNVTTTGRGVFGRADDEPKVYPMAAFRFAGSNIHIENCQVDASLGGSVFSSRREGLYGQVVIKDIAVVRNQGDVLLYHHWVPDDHDMGFDHADHIPDHVLIADITLANPGRLQLSHVGINFKAGTYAPVTIRSAGPIGDIRSNSSLLSLINCALADAHIDIPSGGYVSFEQCTFRGHASGLMPDQIDHAIDNLVTQEAALSFPSRYINPGIYQPQ